MVVAWTTFSIMIGRTDEFMDRFNKYVTCMEQGIRDNEDCSSYKKDIEDLSHPSLNMIYTVLFAFFNFFSLPLVIQFRTVKHSMTLAARRMSRRSTAFFSS